MNGESAIRKLLRVAGSRPGRLYRILRGYLLFSLARVFRRIRPIPGVALGENVRLQRNGSLMAERPSGTITVGADSIIYEDCSLEAYGGGSITVGNSSIIGGARVLSRFGIDIGSRFLCSWDVFIQDYDSHPVDPKLRARQVERMVRTFRPSFGRMIAPPEFEWPFPGEPIQIGDDVWVGAGATILKGARIGSGSIVATGAVVLKGTYPANSLIAGNPAVVVKSLAESPILKAVGE